MKVLRQKRVRWFFAGTLLSLYGLVHANGLNTYIVGGAIVTDDTKYPFMVSVYFDAIGANSFEPGCGGTLISDRWVLTAAHCLYNNDFNRPISVERIGVLLGEKDLTQGQDGNFVKAKRLITHPEYDAETNQNDIGLIELLEPYDAPLALVPSVDSPVPVLGEPGLVLGWGVIEESGEQSTKLREVNLPVISNAACFPFYPNQFDSRLAFCAGGSKLGGQDACQGDSGGPLLVSRQTTGIGPVYIVAGIVSYGDGCAREGIPGVYTRVEAFTDWINSYTSGTLEYNGQLDAQTVDNTIITQLAVNSSSTGQLLSGQVAYFDVTGARQVNLTSLSGDADLFIIDDADFQDISAELVRCASQEENAIDICVIAEDQPNAYAVVYGYEDSSYTISTQLVSGTADTAMPLETGAQLSSADIGGGALSGKFCLAIFIMCIFRLRSRTAAQPHSVSP